MTQERLNMIAERYDKYMEYGYEHEDMACFAEWAIPELIEEAQKYLNLKH